MTQPEPATSDSDAEQRAKRRLAELDAALAAAEKKANEGKNALEQSVREAAIVRAGDRSYIAKIIVWSFVILMGLVVLAATAGTYFFDWDRVSEPAKFLMTILSSVMLPVVTLVIGYYFGSEK